MEQQIPFYPIGLVLVERYYQRYLDMALFTFALGLVLSVLAWGFHRWRMGHWEELRLWDFTFDNVLLFLSCLPLIYSALSFAQGLPYLLNAENFLTHDRAERMVVERYLPETLNTVGPKGCGKVREYWMEYIGEEDNSAYVTPAHLTIAPFFSELPKATLQLAATLNSVPLSVLSVRCSSGSVFRLALLGNRVKLAVQQTR